jgi:hypothetical protein
VILDLSTIVPVAVPSPIVAPCGLDSVTVSVSAGSSSVSSAVPTSNTALVCPAGMTICSLLLAKSAAPALPFDVVAVTVTADGAGALRLTVNRSSKLSRIEVSAIETVGSGTSSTIVPVAVRLPNDAGPLRPVIRAVTVSSVSSSTSSSVVTSKKACVSPAAIVTVAALGV